jgi:hypothetical protein
MERSLQQLKQVFPETDLAYLVSVLEQNSNDIDATIESLLSTNEENNSLQVSESNSGRCVDAQVGNNLLPDTEIEGTPPDSTDQWQVWLLILFWFSNFAGFDFLTAGYEFLSPRGAQTRR